MKRLLPVFLLLALAAFAAPASAAPLFHSDNVTQVTSLPEAAGAASARFSPDGKFMYVSTWKGLHVYDITKPDDPQRVGVLPLPHFENEDVEAGDGVVIITNDPSEGLGLIYIIDVSDPTAPMIRSIIRNGDIAGASNELAADGTTSNTGHIANCLQGCRWLWTTGTSEGISIFDLRDLDSPKFVKQMEMPHGKGKDGGGFTHDVFLDRSGVAWITGQDGTFGYDAGDPANPKLLFRSDENVTNSGNDGPASPDTANSYPLDFLHHNSIRTDIQLAPRPVETGAEAAAPGTAGAPSSSAPGQAAPAARRSPTRRQLLAKMKRSIRSCGKKHGKRARAACEKRARAAFRRADARRRAARYVGGRAGSRTTLGGLGDIMAVTEEDYTRPGCNGQGSIQTWQITPGEHNSDGSTKLKLLDMWTTELNELDQQTGRSPGTVLCSAHWFDEDRGLLAQGWYDQGVRFMDINNPRDIRQVGYWVTSGTFWGAYYAPTDPKRETVYALDIQNGIDVLHIDRSKGAGAMRTVTAPIPAAWKAPAATRSLRPSATWGFACPLLLRR